MKLNDGKTYTVTSIKEDAFKDNTLLTSITLPSTVTTIEATAFEGSALTAIKIPEGLTKIGAAAFRRTKLTSIVLPSTVKDIRANAFEASSLQSADLSAAQLGVMNDYIFSKCEQLSEVKFPSNVSGINFNNYAFSDCKSLKTMTLPACSIHFYSNIFDGSGLENVIFPEGCTLTGLGPCTFQSTQIKTITLPESCKSIDARAFYNTPLTTIHLPEALTTINANAFASTSLTDIVIPAGVTTIGTGAFENTTSLQSATILSPNVELTSKVFAGSALQDLYLPAPGLLKSISDDAFTTLPQIHVAPSSVEAVKALLPATYDTTDKIDSKYKVKVDVGLFTGFSSAFNLDFSPNKYLYVYKGEWVESQKAVRYHEIVYLPAGTGAIIKKLKATLSSESNEVPIDIIDPPADDTYAKSATEGNALKPALSRKSLTNQGYSFVLNGNGTGYVGVDGYLAPGTSYLETTSQTELAEGETIPLKLGMDALNKVILTEYNAVKDSAQAVYDAYATYVPEEAAALKTLLDAADPTTITTVAQAISALRDASAKLEPASRPVIAGYYQNVVENYPQDATALLGDLAEWNGRMQQVNVADHWSGEANTEVWSEQISLYDKYDLNTWSSGKQTTITLPAGKYALFAAGRSTRHAVLTMSVAGQKVRFPQNGSTGLGIEKDGSANYDAEGSYAGDGKGTGWEWRTIEFELAKDSTVCISILAQGETHDETVGLSDLCLLTTCSYKTLYNSLHKTADKMGEAANVGTAALQIPQAAYDTFKAGLTEVEGLKKLTASQYQIAFEKLSDVANSYRRTSLNPLTDDQPLNITASGNEGWSGEGKTLTFYYKYDKLSDNRADFSKDAGCGQIQALTFKPTENKNEFYLSETEYDGTTRTVTTEARFDDDLRKEANLTIGDAEKLCPVPFCIEPTTTEGVYMMANSLTGQYVSMLSESDNRFVSGDNPLKVKIGAAAKCEVTLEITDDKWSTFVAPYNVTLPDGVKAYICSDTLGTAVRLTEVEGNKLEALKAYVVYSDKPVSHTYADYAASHSLSRKTGLLWGYLTEYDVRGKDHNFILKNVDGEVGFHYVEEQTHLEPFGTYMFVYKNGVSMYSLEVVPTEPGTAIKGTEADTNTGEIKEVARYNAEGMKVTAPVKGLNIIRLSNGKTVKVMIK